LLDSFDAAEWVVVHRGKGRNDFGVVGAYSRRRDSIDLPGNDRIPSIDIQKNYVGPFGLG
jgi:hypothetical protein